MRTALLSFTLIFTCAVLMALDALRSTKQSASLRQKRKEENGQQQAQDGVVGLNDKKNHHSSITGSSSSNGTTLNHGEVPLPSNTAATTATTITTATATSGIASISTSVTSSASTGTESNVVVLEQLRQRLQPHPLLWTEHEENTLEERDDGEVAWVKTTKKVGSVHQFLHLHHMKTGGTSMDELMQCAMQRVREDWNVTLPYMVLHECSEEPYRQCKSGSDARCFQRIQQAAIMSYCAPLKDLITPFTWERTTEHPVHAVTVLRDPVQRVWSMYRFQTKNCYRCRSLVDVYKEMETLTESQKTMCHFQLENHLTRNVLHSALPDWNATTGQVMADTDKDQPQQIIQQAIHDMTQFFTVVGLTEDLPTTHEIVGRVFPWLAERVPGSDTPCRLPHANASPTNNRCGPKNTHKPLPDYPDEETVQMILKHNQWDVRLYQAAVQHFQLQKQALGMV